MADTPPGETVVVEDPKNNATPTVTPPVEKAVDPELEKARKEAEQATLRANQLANQLKAKEDADATAKAKELEEQNKFKDLYEQEKARREEAETAKEKSESAAAVKAKQDEIFAGYSEEVKNLATELGVTLTDTEDDTVEAFKAKLDKAAGTIKSPKVTPNNPGNPGTSSDAPMDPAALQAIMRDPIKFQDYLNKNFKGIASMQGPKPE